MAKSGPPMTERIASVCDLTVRDGIYSEESKTAYWIIKKTGRNVVLENADGERYACCERRLTRRSLRTRGFGNPAAPSDFADI